MFERFTDRMRQVVLGAQAEARRRAAGHIGTEHLLLAMLADDDALGSRILHRLGVDGARAMAAVDELTRSDAEALGVLGIDLDAVRARVEARFGPGALDRGAGPRRRRWRLLRRGGHIPFSPGAKKVLELSLREALALKHNYVGTEHLLLALVRAERDTAARVLRRLGVPPLDQVRALVLDELRRAA